MEKHLSLAIQEKSILLQHELIEPLQIGTVSW